MSWRHRAECVHQGKRGSTATKGRREGQICLLKTLGVFGIFQRLVRSVHHWYCLLYHVAPSHSRLKPWSQLLRRSHNILTTGQLGCKHRTDLHVACRQYITLDFERGTWKNRTTYMVMHSSTNWLRFAWHGTVQDLSFNLERKVYIYLSQFKWKKVTHE